MKINRKFIPHFSSLLILAFTFIVSCQENLNSVKPSEIKSELTISKAKEIFEGIDERAKFNRTAKANANEITKSYDNYVEQMTADWDSAKYRITESGQTITVPIDFGIHRFSVDKEKKAVYDRNHLNYLTMYKDNNNNIHTEWVTLVPDSEWLKNRGKYVGQILIREWSGEFVKAFEYKKTGNVTQFRVPTHSETRNAKTTTLMNEYCWQFDGMGCYYTPRRSAPYCDTPFQESFCVTVIVEDDPMVPVGGTGSIPTSGQPWTSVNNGTGLGGNGSGSGSYTPNECNPNLAGGTSVPSNQLPPCTAISSIPAINGGITYTYNSLQDMLQDNVFAQLWNDSLNQYEKAWFQTGFNWAYFPDFCVNVAQTRLLGILYFQNPDVDNGNANAFRHMVLAGLNSLAMGETKARELAELHEKNQHVHANQTLVDSINNEEGLKLARVHKNIISLVSAISNWMRTPGTAARRTFFNSNSGTLLPTTGDGRTAFGASH